MTDTPHQLADDNQLNALLAELPHAPFVALDTEFHAERRYRPRFLLLQVHVPGRGIWLVDATRADHLAALAAPLCAVPWVLHAGEQDLRLLQRALGHTASVVWDTQLLAGLVTPSFPSSLGALLRLWLGESVSKGETLSDWSLRPLSQAQLAYAADDVRWLPALFERLTEALKLTDRLKIARSACDAARDRALTPQHELPLWREVRGHQVLSRAQLAVLAELTRWRETVASELDQPRGSVAHDAVLTWIARSQPTTLDELRSRRTPKTLGAKYGEALLACVRQGQSVATDAQPDIVRADEPRAATLAVLHAHAEVLAHEQQWARRLVLPSPLLEDVALDISRGAPLRLPEWIDGLVGDRLRHAISGRVAVVLASGAATQHRVE